MSEDFQNADFATTHWSIVVASGKQFDSEIRRKSLSKLCSDYWFPLFVYLRRKGYAASDSADYVQGFFLELIDKDYLQVVSPEVGRFRWFLMSSIGRYVGNQIAKATTQKRGGDVAKFSIDVEDAEHRYQLEPIDGWTAEKLFDRRWAVEVLRQALAQLKTDYEKKSKSKLFELLQPLLTVDADSAQQYSEIAARLGMTVGSVKVSAHRIRQEYRDHLKQIVSQTVSSRDEIGDELESLLAAFRGN